MMKNLKKGLAAVLALILALSLGLSALGEESLQILVPGDTGERVTALQERLIGLQYLRGPASGTYDAETEEAVALFQNEHGLMSTGMTDSVTWELLMSDKARHWEPDPTNLPWNAARDYAADAYATEEYEEGLYALSGTFFAQTIPFSTDEYTFIPENGFRSVSTAPLSTFAADVDTASYAQLRALILSGQRVPADAVRIEEMLNYFH